MEPYYWEQFPSQVDSYWCWLFNIYFSVPTSLRLNT